MRKISAVAKFVVVVLQGSLLLSKPAKSSAVAQGLGDGGGAFATACPSVPNAEQIKGLYAGFAIWTGAKSPKPVNDSRRLGSLASELVANTFTREGTGNNEVWETKMDLLRAANRFWETWAGKIELKSRNNRRLSIVTRGIRPLNARSTFVRGTITASDSQTSSILSSLFGGVFASSSDSSNPDEEVDGFFSRGYFDADEEQETNLALSLARLDSSEGAPAGKTSATPGKTGTADSGDYSCQVSGTVERYSHNLKDSDDNPPVEVSSDRFERGPDLIMHLAIAGHCRYPEKSLSIAMRKYNVDFFRIQHSVIGIVVALKTLLEIAIYSRQYKQLESHRSLLKTSHWTIGLGILYDSFEAQFFFGQQSMGSEIAFLSTLSLIGLLKILLICVVEMRWLVTLWKERCIQNRHALGDPDPQGWVRDMNFFIRTSALVMVISLFLATHLFGVVPELVILTFCLFFTPQIMENIYGGIRHPLSSTFIIGSLLCRFVFPWLLWSSVAQRLWRSAEMTSQRVRPLTEEPWPHWFAGPAALKIPNSFIDTIFGSVARRPNSITLAVIASIMVWQGIHLLVQQWWSPRAGIPDWICVRFLPAVFDYELDVARVAALKQLTEPGVTMVDCVICFTPVKYADKGCIVTPCEHFFHKNCLCKWMEVKLECPTCRRLLPPF